MWFGRSPVGCPGTACQLAPPSSERNRLVSRVETPAYSVREALPFPPLAGSNATKAIPTGCSPFHDFTPADADLETAGNVVTSVHDTPLSPLRHRPFARLPNNRTRPSFGSTARRSPLPRPCSLPPSLNGKLARSKRLPPSLERRIAPS